MRASLKIRYHLCSLQFALCQKWPVHARLLLSVGTSTLTESDVSNSSMVDVVAMPTDSQPGKSVKQNVMS